MSVSLNLLSTVRTRRQRIHHMCQKEMSARWIHTQERSKSVRVIQTRKHETVGNACGQRGEEEVADDTRDKVPVTLER